ncbi:PREDICTED: plexin-B1 isoform X3 [Pygoscelis adeliae]|uniref:plexin-B1 isoform X2 n=1 Tax=Pygoscelis adeliae TaxID=9238 RepID=UPI0004F4D55F|nr:PREDICTED: plexin-B1 isoform X2 [Pygoscelis adeliae]XP_009328215.1 PREDICTED: plexin-B1 isoform X3 [Pygoscelis adeliae]
MPLGTFLLPVLCFLGAAIPPGLQYVTFSRNATKFLHLSMDLETGTIYLGATNFLFQLTSDLLMKNVVQTGPVLDSKDCLPPVSKLECPQAHYTDNHNKLLLVNAVQKELIVCGSVHQGICEKRSLTSIDHILFRPESPGDTQYVAANDPNITTVGLIAYSKDEVPLLFVGRGYTSRGVGGGIPPITTRNLRAHGGDVQATDSHSIFSYEETAKLAVGRLSEYNHHFIKSFTYRSSVYFLFYRRDLKSQSREYKTYISRICLDDSHYYSYVELPLLCQSKATTYSLLQAAYVTQPGEGLAQGQLATNGEVLFAAFSAWQASSGKLSEESALCVYAMEEVDRLTNWTRDVCYMRDGKSEEGTEVAYIEYDVSSNCVQLPADTLYAYPCGSDHTPSPMASRVPLEAAPLLEKTEARLTAVAVNVEDGHTIAFLGDSRGRLHKVYLGAMGDAHIYASLAIQLNSMVSGDLLFDQLQEHLFVMTQSMVVKVPILECSLYLDCESCLALKDPYCGWCVLQGRCSRRSECLRSRLSEQWLWSFNSTQQCLSVQSLTPANISREEKRNIFLAISDLPSLREEEFYSCYFEDYESPAVLTESGIMCPSPDPSQAPALPTGADHVTIKLVVRFHDIFIASVDFSFYDCAAVALLWKSAPCQKCVSSLWGCNWCIQQHLCTHKAACEEGTIIYNERNEELNWGPDACPCVQGIQGSSLFPVNVARKITLLGKNFHLYQDQQWDYECVLNLEGRTVVMDAYVEGEETNQSLCYITCQMNQYSYTAPQLEFNAVVFVQRRRHLRVDSAADLHVTFYNCSVGHTDCSRCQTADSKYNCVWCGGDNPSCIFRGSCKEEIEDLCPAPLIHSVYPLSGPVEGGTRITITGSNLGQKHQDIAETVTVAGIPCAVDAQEYEISSSIVCVTGGSWTERFGHIVVEVPGGGRGVSGHIFTYQNPELKSIIPTQGPKAGGTCLTLLGSKLLTGHPSEISVLLGDLPCHILSEMTEDQLACQTSPSNVSAELPVTIKYGDQERRLEGSFFRYTLDPNITFAEPPKSFLSGGRVLRVHGYNLDVVQKPKIRVTVSPSERRRRGLGRWRRIIPDTECPEDALCSIQQFEEPCLVNSSYLILCKTPAINLLLRSVHIKLEFILDNLSFDFNSLHPMPFSYEVNPILKPLNAEDPAKPYRHKPGSVISVEGENLDLAISKDEVMAMIGEGICVVKTLTRNHLYCEPPSEQPAPRHRTKREGTDLLPEFTVQMGNLNFLLGRVQYDTESQLTFPLEAQIGLGVGASFVALIVLVIVFIYRRKSKQALRDYKKVQIQLENLETSVRDRCKKEFTDLMTEMMDLTSDLVGTGIPFLDYKSYAERIFFPGHRESPLQRDLDIPECRRQTVEQGLVQLSNLLNSKLFLTKFIHTLEIQRTFSPRDRAYVASLLTVSLHGKLEYFTDILKTLLNDLVEQYVAKNPKLMLRRTETVVEKLLTNWMSICLYAFVRDSVGEPLYMLFRGIKHQVDKGPVDWVTGKAKYTLNDNRLLREDLEYRTLTLNALTQAGVAAGGAEDSQGISAKVLDCDTITQVKEKILDQIYKGTPYCHRPDPDTLDLEWRSGLAGHLILSDEDVTSVVQGTWKRLNTLQHYKVPDGATVALVPRLTKHIHRENQDYIPGEKTPMLEDADEGGIKLWHLVKPTEEPELPKHRRGSLRDRERAKAIPEIYLTRLLSMKGTLQKFVDDLFQVILSTNRPVPLAVKYFFDLLDEQAIHYGIADPETIHIWKTNSLPLRFWINIIKNPQFVFDVQTSDNVDAVLLVIAQTFMDSCTIADHKLGRDSPINKLLYARDIPRYKQMVERYYADIRQTISASDQEMNSALAELSRNYSGDLNSLVALHELYKYINKYYDQIITALEEDPTAQKMQLGYRLQQIAAAVENKVTDL